MIDSKRIKMETMMMKKPKKMESYTQIYCLQTDHLLLSIQNIEQSKTFLNCFHLDFDYDLKLFLENCLENVTRFFVFCFQYGRLIGQEKLEIVCYFDEKKHLKKFLWK